MLQAPQFDYQPNKSKAILDVDLGFSEPIVDRERWKKDNVLSMLLQRNEQPNYDTNPQDINHQIILIDVKFKIIGT